MKLAKNSKVVKTILWGTLIVSVIPPTFTLIQQWYYGAINQTFYCTAVDYAQSTLFSLVVTFTLFITNVYIIGTLTDKLEGKINSYKRIALCLFLGIVSSNIIIYLEWKLFNNLFFHIEPPLENTRIFSNQVIATILVVIVSLVLEIRHYVKQLKLSIAEKEKLERAFLRAQLEGLKTQISPHFLFNSFNALQSLIEDNPEKAKSFVQELARVYRYVLDKRDNLVVKLSDEISFIHSYVYLNKIRFGENLKIEINIESNLLQHFLPPLTLQLLIENAIKHNIISASKPLHIVISTADDMLVVTNNYQPRAESVLSTQIGHSNLTDRYKLICDKVPIFGIVGTNYVAKVPLVDESQAEEL